MTATLKTTPARDGFRMPAESEPHAGCWMLWPERPDNWRRKAQPAQAAFAAATAPLKDRAAFIYLNRGSDHEIIARLTAIARTFDLVVLGQAQDDVPAPPKLPDAVIADSGRPQPATPQGSANGKPDKRYRFGNVFTSSPHPSM